MVSMSNAPNENEIYPRRFGPGKIILLIIVLIVSTLLAGAYIFMESTSVKTKDESSKSMELTGKIYLTLAEKGSQRANIYFVDVSSGTIEEVVKNSADGFDKERFTRRTSSLSPNGDDIAFFIADRINDPNPDRGGFMLGSPLILLTFKLANQNDWNVWTAASTTMPFRGNPAWSPNSKQIAFEGFSAPISMPPNAYPIDWSDPDEWNVMMTTADDDTDELLTSGSYPKWTPDGSHILFLRSDGIYAINPTTTNTPDRIISTQDHLRRTDYFDISVISDSLAIGIEGVIMFYDIESWDLLHISWKDSTTDARYFYSWPTFSPDGRHLAALRYTRGEPDADIVIINTENPEQEQIIGHIDSGIYDTSVSFISDWR